MGKIEIHFGDITELEVDAVVNAANSSLLGGGGVDGAIHRVAGRKLLEKCKTLKGCKTGEAKITPGYNLPAKYVIHTVGPVWSKGKHDDAALLMSCYQKSLELALENNIETIAFPNISTGVYGFPKEKAAEAAVATVKKFLSKHPEIKKVIFAVFDRKNLKIYKKKLLLEQ